MKINCLKNYLKEAISLTERISGKNINLPILKNTLIFTDNNKLKLRSTNLEIGIEIDIPAKIEKNGKVAIPSNIIYNFLSSFSGDENIYLESINNNLSISTINTSILIKGQPTNDFPNLPVVKSKKLTSFKAQDLLNGLKSVYYAASISNIKPEISSVNIYTDKKNQLTFIATDSFRLAEKKLPYKFLDFPQIIIPYKNVLEILRIFENKEGKIDLIFDNNQILFIHENIKIISRIIDGIFPDYNQIIPDKFITDVVLDKKNMINILKTASVFSNRLNELNIIIEPKNKFITIQTSNSDTGEYVTKMPANITGEEIKMVFNYKYIQDSLPFFSSEKIILRFSGEGKPLLIRGTDDNSFLYIVMPMNSV